MSFQTWANGTRAPCSNQTSIGMKVLQATEISADFSIADALSMQVVRKRPGTGDLWHSREGHDEDLNVFYNPI